MRGRGFASDGGGSPVSVQLQGQLDTLEEGYEHWTGDRFGAHTAPTTYVGQVTAAVSDDSHLPCLPADFSPPQVPAQAASLTLPCSPWPSSTPTPLPSPLPLACPRLVFTRCGAHSLLPLHPHLGQLLAPVISASPMPQGPPELCPGPNLSLDWTTPCVLGHGHPYIP